ncbi:S46 family peptidase [candidate division KSB1 bacterium]|nr:S46 family peptidase [candidate division KSB1 bacterium]
MQRRIIFFKTLILTLLFINLSQADEGMYPISEIHKLDLKSKGLEIAPLEIYNPDGISLVDGICNIGGCTGSFVSADGLILTNHHCAFRAIQSASSKENDYLENGFLAQTREEEVPARGYTVRITESYRDVSKEVLKVVKDKMELAERTRAIEKKIKEIITAVEKKNPGKRAEVSEMFIGKTYVLFIYTYLKDVRLVFAPPRAIGNFGGEEDNWMWPRHTGDFSFMRAYMAPDGSSADYAVENIPYHPKKYLKVAPEGVNESDFVFILGYPGRTSRHQTAAFMAYEQNVRMPYIVNWYQWQIKVMEQMGQKDRAIALKLAPRIRGLANTEKNYRGKLIGMQRLNLVEKKQKEEEKLQKFIDADPTRQAKYSRILTEINEIYQKLEQESAQNYVLGYLRRSSSLLNAAYTVYEASIERKKKDVERESAFMDRNFQRTREALLLGMKDFDEATDKIIFKEILRRAVNLQTAQSVPAIADLKINKNDIENSLNLFLQNAYSQSKLHQKEYLASLLEKNTEEISKMDDPFIQLAVKLYPTYKELDEVNKARQGAIDRLYAQLIDVKKEFLTRDFVPDANGTLRLTYGYIRGYRPKDATYYEPITTTQGVLEKTTSNEPFDSPAKLIDLIKNKDFGQFAHPKLKQVPVAILYNMDTVGGNSGSPVLNARGELVGVNYDRAFEATINDYAWSEDYSRSIAVDIRYVLWVTQKLGNANFLLQEMGIVK